MVMTCRNGTKLKQYFICAPSIIKTIFLSLRALKSSFDEYSQKQEIKAFARQKIMKINNKLNQN